VRKTDEERERERERERENMIFDEYLWNPYSKIISTIVPCNICFSIKAYNPKKKLYAIEIF